jgi:hypothetical protein
MQVGLDLVDESGPTVVGGVKQAKRLGLSTHGIDDFVTVLLQGRKAAGTWSGVCTDQQV